MEDRTYRYIFENSGGSSKDSPVAGDKTQPEQKKSESDDSGNSVGLASVLVAWNKVSPYAYSAVSYEISKVELITGATEHSQRAQSVFDLTKSAIGVVESAIAGGALTGGNPIGFIVGTAVGVLSTAVGYAQNAGRLGTERKIEDVSLAMQRRRAGTARSRSDNQ